MNAPGNPEPVRRSSLWSAVRSFVRAALPARPTRDDRWWGRRGERDAERFLKEHGFRILGRNAHLGAFEADLVCEDPDRRTIVVVEVKARVRKPDGSPAGNALPPAAAITAHKRRNLRGVLHALLAANHWLDRPRRVDVVEVVYHLDASGRPGPPAIRHLANAVASRG
ncbi:MAG: YraN family protein [Phycisphaeraceae bacterium]|nr:MAG: YraN family protein [Phycisphaeraceae bacterium]